MHMICLEWVYLSYLGLIKFLVFEVYAFYEFWKVFIKHFCPLLRLSQRPLYSDLWNVRRSKLYWSLPSFFFLFGFCLQTPYCLAFKFTVTSLLSISDNNFSFPWRFLKFQSFGIPMCSTTVFKNLFILRLSFMFTLYLYIRDFILLKAR